VRKILYVIKSAQWLCTQFKSTSDKTYDLRNVTDLQYFVTGLPKDASQSERRKLHEELANAIGNLDTSDVFVISIWIGD
jgi:actin-like ATPase involved in cell morphogenesis